MKWREDIQSVHGALKRFGHRMVTNKRLLTLMVIAVVSLVGVVVLYESDPRLSEGPWHTYADGLFSVNEDRYDHYEEFDFDADFKQEIERRCGGKLLCAFQKTVRVITESDESYLHINVVDLSDRFKRLYSSESAVASKYFTKNTPMFADYDIKRIAPIHGYQAMEYKSPEREGGYYTMGVVVLAHKHAYFYEHYSHYSPFADWQNDNKTYYFSEAGGFSNSFTVDDMEDIENQFFIYSLVLFGAYLMAGILAFRMLTRGIIHHAPQKPVINFQAQRRFQMMNMFTVVMHIVMIVMMVAFWQYKGASTLQEVSFILLGLIILGFNLPTVVHLYKKARGRV